jgi:hypothetical protein
MYRRLSIGFHMKWALRKLRVVRIIRAMYEGVSTAYKLDEEESVAFTMGVGIHQGLVLSFLLFTIVLEAV